MIPRWLCLFTTLVFAQMSVHAAGFPMQTLQMGGLLENSRDVRQVLPGYNSYLKGYWRFEGNFSDVSGQSNHAQPKGGATTGVGGQVGAAASFNGTSSYLDFATPVLTSATNISVSVWFNQTALGTSFFYVQGVTSGCNPSSQGLGTDSLGHLVGAVGCGSRIVSTTIYQANQWNHAVMTKDSSSNVRLYLNSELVAGPFNHNGGMSLSTGNELIGSAWDSGVRQHFFNGKIDELALWNGVVLSANDVLQLYRAGIKQLGTGSIVGDDTMGRSYSDGSYAASCYAYRFGSRYTGATGNGVYWIKPAATAFKAYCDMTTDGGGWTLVLNYLHLGGTNPNLNVLSSRLPLLGANSLGIDESASTGTDGTWGHASPSLMQQIPYTDLRLYCRSNAVSRVMHFKMSNACKAYFNSGSGNCAGIVTDFSALAGHTALIPTSVNSYFENQATIAMTEFPFWRNSAYHWGIRGGGVRWECDDYNNSSSFHTQHHIFVR